MFRKHSGVGWRNPIRSRLDCHHFFDLLRTDFNLTRTSCYFNNLSFYGSERLIFIQFVTDRTTN